MRTVYIDLSAKTEEWRLDSVVVMSNGGDTVLIIPSKVKRDARDWLKEQDRHKRKEAVYVYRLLATFVFLAVGPGLNSIEQLIIDDDYPGAGAAIKNELVPLLQQKQRDFQGRQIHFQRVKGSQADQLARSVFQSKQREGYLVTLQEILDVWGKI